MAAQGSDIIDAVLDWSSLIFYLALGGLPLIAGAIVLGWQIYQYLLFGDWISMSVADGLTTVGLAWAGNPKSWFGLHEILSWLSLTATLIVGGLLLLVGGVHEWLARMGEKYHQRP